MIAQIGAVFVLRSDGAALLQHRDDKPGLRDAGMWVPPGGHRDNGESMEECARRELWEETDYRCGELWKLAQYQPDHDGDWPGCELHIFWTWYDGLQTVTCREGQALQFVKRAEACYYPIPRGLVAAWDLAITAGATEKR